MIGKFELIVMGLQRAPGHLTVARDAERPAMISHNLYYPFCGQSHDI